MTQQSSQGSKPLKVFYQCLLFKQSVALISGLSILGSGLVLTQATATPNAFVVPETAAPSAPASNPEPTSPSTQAAPTAPSVRLAAPKVSIPPATRREAPVPKSNSARQSQPLVTQGKNSYIDTTNYSRGGNQGYTAPSTVILTERSTGCKAISQNGQLTSGNCGVATSSVAVRKPSIMATRQSSSSPRIQVNSRSLMATRLQPVRLKSQNVNPNVQPVVRLSPLSSNRSAIAGAANSQYNSTTGTVVALAPIPPQAQLSGGTLGLEPIPQYNRATTMVQPISPDAYGRTDLIFPLPIPAKISSVFGWRIHPIAATARMHEGTDIAAPQGTPVLAAYPGEVAVADWQGGYGLTVILRHQQGTQESRYAHLSEIFVRPGEWVQQGTVIGQVGSTGMSTGPHLHFEWRHLTAQGWVAVDAGLHLEYALDGLMHSLQLANANSQPGG